jgi:hypothetical protein
MPLVPPDLSEDRLDHLQHAAFQFFAKQANPANGLVPDHTRAGAPSSIAATGLGLACYGVGVERGYLDRTAAAERTLTTLRFFWESEQSEAPDATGHRGFYYHFLDMDTGRRALKCELSTIDTTFLLAGALAAAQYFDGDGDTEAEIRTLADALYRRADWDWATNEGLGVTHGWKPETGFLRARWQGYNEALLLYALALGSPNHPIGPAHYDFWLETYKWKKLYGYEHVWAGPLFVHQLSHVWIDFREIRDAYMRRKSEEFGEPVDYFENSRRATYVQQRYAVRNPRDRVGYGEFAWGITASDGPGPAVRTVDGEEVRFYDYHARGVPWGPDDGTLAPWAVAASLPFAPEIVLPTLQHFDEAIPELTSRLGYRCSLNPTFPDGRGGSGGWVSDNYYGIDQGPVVLMIENYRTESVWRRMRACPAIADGLRRCGFTGGWLEG